MAIIALNGYATVGKDEVAKIIQDLTKVDDGGLSYRNVWEIKKFSSKLKDVATILTGIPKEKFEDQDFKNSFLGSEWIETGADLEAMTGWLKPMYVRDFLQRLGTDAVRDGLHKNAWVNALMSEYTIDKNWIITDCRFENEARAIKHERGIIIRIDRSGVSPVNAHESETALDNWDFDYKIANVSDLVALRQSVEVLLNKIL